MAALYNPFIDATFMNQIDDPSQQRLLYCLEAPHRQLAHTSYMCQMRFFAAQVYSILYGLGQRVVPANPIFRTAKRNLARLNSVLTYFISSCELIHEIHALYNAKVFLEQSKRRGRYTDLDAEGFIEDCLKQLEGRIPNFRKDYISYDRAARKVGNNCDMLSVIPMRAPIAFIGLRHTSPSISNREILAVLDFKYPDDIVSSALNPILYDPLVRFRTFIGFINNHQDVGLFNLSPFDFALEIAKRSPLKIGPVCGFDDKECPCSQFLRGFQPPDMQWFAPFEWIAKVFLRNTRENFRLGLSLNYSNQLELQEKVVLAEQIGDSIITFTEDEHYWKSEKHFHRQYCYLVLLESLRQQIALEEGLNCPWNGTFICTTGSGLCNDLQMRVFLTNFCKNIHSLSMARNLVPPSCII